VDFEGNVSLIRLKVLIRSKQG